MRRAVLCLLLGTVLSIATAIAATLWSPIRQKPTRASFQSYLEIVALLQNREAFRDEAEQLLLDPASAQVIVDQWSGVGITVTRVHSVPVPDRRELSIPLPEPIGGPLYRTEFRSGWPLRAFVASPSSGAPSSRYRSGFLLESHWVRDMTLQVLGPPGSVTRLLAPASAPVVRIPLRPELLPLLGNIAFWSLSCFALLAGAHQARARIRTFRGMCPRCRYPTRGLAHCPECGPTHTPTPV